MIHALLLAAAIAANASTAPGMSGSHGRYLGAPDLVLTTQMIEAGGGPAHFSSHKLYLYLTGAAAQSEAASLTKRYDGQNVGQFFTTFDQFVHLAVVQVQQKNIKLPNVVPPSPKELARKLYSAGVMADGRYDVGYMLEHLLSRPMHVVLMNEVNGDPAFGPQKNAEFHIILTAAMQDLHKVYGD
jgi:hypothetical protein